MRKINFFVSAMIFLIIISGIGYSNHILIKDSSTRIDTIYEIDEIREKDLYTYIEIGITIGPYYEDVSRNITVNFDPYYDGKINNFELINVEVCKNTTSSFAHSYTIESIKSQCEEFEEDFYFEKTDKNTNYPSYDITFSVPNIDVYRTYDIRITYKMIDALTKEGSKYVIGFQKECSPKVCEGHQWQRTVLLPFKSIITDYPEDVMKTFRSSGKWVVEIGKINRVAYLSFYNEYEREQNDFIVNFIGNIIYLIIGACISVCISYWLVGGKERDKKINNIENGIKKIIKFIKNIPIKRPEKKKPKKKARKKKRKTKRKPKRIVKKKPKKKD